MPAFVITKKLDQGVSNPIVARLTLQIFEILQNCAIPKHHAEAIQNIYLTDLTPKLLRCEQLCAKLRADIEQTTASFKPPGKGTVSVKLPQVMHLDEDCRTYLYEAKIFLRDLLKVFNILFGTAFEESSEWTIQKKPRPSVIRFAEEQFQAQPDHIRYLQQLPRCIEPFVRMRNAVEHPGGHSGTLDIRNFQFGSNGALTPPDWRREKDGQIAYGPVSIVDDMSVGVGNLFALAEDILVMWAIDHAALPGLMEMTVVPEGVRNPGCPIKSRMGFSASLTPR